MPFKTPAVSEISPIPIPVGISQQCALNTSNSANTSNSPWITYTSRHLSMLIFSCVVSLNIINFLLCENLSQTFHIYASVNLKFFPECINHIHLLGFFAELEENSTGICTPEGHWTVQGCRISDPVLSNDSVSSGCLSDLYIFGKMKVDHYKRFMEIIWLRLFSLNL